MQCAVINYLDYAARVVAGLPRCDGGAKPGDVELVPPAVQLAVLQYTVDNKLALTQLVTRHVDR